MTNRDYIPALSYAWLTPFYDPLLRWIMQEAQFKRVLVEVAALAPHEHVLDLGCGTGTLTFWLHQHTPTATLVGLDIDPAVLARARRKSQDQLIYWLCASAIQIPCADDSFDQVVSSLMFHHLALPHKAAALAETYRILRPGGRLTVLDFGRPKSRYGRTLAPLLASLEEAAGQLTSHFSKLFAQAGYVGMQETYLMTTVFGDLSLFTASKPR